LDHDQYGVREKASRELAQLGPAVESLLRQAADNSPTPEAHQRIQAVRDGLKNFKGEAVLDPERVPLAVILLEKIDATESRRVLEELAQGPVETAVNREARAALERRKKPAAGR
jgi:hypothetical protein